MATSVFTSAVENQAALRINDERSTILIGFLERPNAVAEIRRVLVVFTPHSRFEIVLQC